jgi:hypothetical protein
MFVEKLRVVADDAVILPAFDGLLRDVGLDAATEKIVRDYAHGRLTSIRSLADAMPETDDEVELYRTAAAYWLELRFEWQRNNETMNYQTVVKGQPDPRVMAEGAIGSYMLSRLEECLDPSHLEMLARYALSLLQDMHVPSRSAESAA